MNELAYWIAVSSVNGIGPTRFAALLETFGTPGAIWHAQSMHLEQNLDRRTLQNLLEARRTVEPQTLLARVQQAGVQCLTWDDPAYPLNLRHIDGPPPVLYVDGLLDERDNRAVALVGTRRASPYGREIAHRLASELARQDVTVVSGLALGVDAVAHRAALDAGGRSVAVLGSGLDLVYPLQNRDLARAMARRGAVVSDYPLGTRPEPRNFPARNRIISGLSLCVVIVEAGERSGALITAEFAAEQGREVFAVPGSILHAGSVGCNRLIQQGATPLLAVDDVLERMDLDRRRNQAEVRRALPDNPLEAALLEQLTQAPLHIDELVRTMPVAPAEINSTLAMMELKGLVRQIAPMCYVRS